MDIREFESAAGIYTLTLTDEGDIGLRNNRTGRYEEGVFTVQTMRQIRDALDVLASIKTSK